MVGTSVRDRRYEANAGKDHGHGEGREEMARAVPVRQKNRHENNADGKSGDERGIGDLLRAIEGTAHWQRLLHGQVAVSVLKLHRCVIDKDADGKRQAAECHHVDGFAEKVEDRERHQDRERDRDTDDDGAAPASEEEQNHQPRKPGGY